MPKRIENHWKRAKNLVRRGFDEGFALRVRRPRRNPPTGKKERLQSRSRVFLTNDEWQYVKDKAELLGLAASHYVRRVVVDEPPRASNDPALHLQLRNLNFELTKHGQVLKDIAKDLNAQKCMTEDVTLALASAREALVRTMRVLKNAISIDQVCP